MNARELRLSDDALLRERDRQRWARSEKRRRTAPKRAAEERRKAEKRAAHREATADLREQVVALAGARCERCRDWTPSALGHMHHTLSGHGRRRQEQSIENVAWLCPNCHAFLHAYPSAARTFRDELAAKRSGPSPSPASPQETP